MSEDEFDHPLVKIGELMDEFEVLYFKAKDLWLDEKTEVEAVVQTLYLSAVKLIEATDMMFNQFESTPTLIPKRIGIKKPPLLGNQRTKK